MKAPCALHLPGAASPWGSAGEPAVSPAFPAFDAGQADAVWNALMQAAVAWSRRTVDERIEIIAAAAAALRVLGPGAHGAVLAQSAGLSPAGVAAAWDVTFAPYDGAALRAAIEAEALRDRLAAAPPRRVVHVLAGNVLPSCWSMLVRGFVVGAAQWLRPAQREPLFAALIGHHLRTVAPELAATVAMTWWPHDDAGVARAVLGGAEIVTAQGGDAAIAALATSVRRWAKGAQFVGYGARWSAGLVSRAAQTPEVAALLAHDIALFDQQGCLSPSLILAEDHAGLEAWCAALAAALAALEQRLPRGPRAASEHAGLRLWRETMRLSVALGTARRLWQSEGTTAWAVLLGNPDAIEDSPLDRHAVVLPFTTRDGAERVLRPRLPRLQGVAVAAPEWPPETRAGWIGMLRPTRVATPGTLQAAPPDWCQDGRPPFATLLS